jgi:DNA repair protein RadC
MEDTQLDDAAPRAPASTSCSFGDLSTCELLAIVVGGKRGKETAARVLDHGLAALVRQPRHPGLTRSEQARVVAAIELARRLRLAAAPLPRTIRTSVDLAPHLIAKYGAEEQERLGVVLLKRRKVVGEREMFVGQHDGATVGIGEVVREALLVSASGIVIYHNHPSGDPTPSPQDLAITCRFEEACFSMEIEFLDHLVVTRTRYCSFRERGWLAR